MTPMSQQDATATPSPAASSADGVLRLEPGTRVVGGWAVGSLLGEWGPVQRCSAKGPLGQRALLEVIAYTGQQPLESWMTDFIEEVETWGDASGGPLLRILAAGRMRDQNLVVRVLEAPPGVSVGRMSVPVSAGHVARIGGQVARALASAHARGLVHGELDGQRVHVRGNDITLEPGGLLQLLHASGVAGARARGPHLAPEALLGQGGRPADVYSLGAMMCRLLSGEWPTRGPAGGQVPGVFGGEAAAELVALVHDCLSDDPHARPLVAEVVRRIQIIEAQLPVHSLSEEATPPSLQRTVEPRVGPVDLVSPPAPPPAPELRSVVPAADRSSAPPRDTGTQVPWWAVGAAAAILAAVLVALALVGL